MPKNCANKNQLLAYAIQGMDGYAGYAGWRWIFILEGLITIAVSVLMFIFIPHFPAKDSWLKPEDKSMLLARLDADKGKETTITVPWYKVLLSYKIWIM